MTYPISITKASHSRISSVDFDHIPFGEVFSDHMFVADYNDGEWSNYRIEPFQPIRMLPSNLALHYGQSIFEGMKASKDINGDVMFFRPELHGARLNNSARRMCMPEFPVDDFLQALHTLVEIDSEWVPTNEGSALYIRPFMYATDEMLGVKVSKTYKMIIFTGPVGPYYPKPVSLKVETEYIRAAVGGVGEAKAAGNYGASMYPAHKAIQEGYDQILWLDAKERKYIQEVGTMNIFFRINDTIVTPKTDGAILHGITRKSIIEILEKSEYNLEVRPVTIDELVQAYDNGELKEIFGAGTAAVIAYISDFTYKGKKCVLHQIDDSNSVSLYLKNQLNQLRSGKIEDRFGWLVPCKSAVLQS